MRSLASFLAEVDPDVVSLAGIDSGDALAAATRFDRQWAYGDGHALLWKKARYEARGVSEGRGVLRVDGACDGADAALFSTHFSSGRERVRELRAARAQMRSTAGDALLFVSEPHGRLGFGDLGFATLGERDEDAELLVGARGFALEVVRTATVGGGVGAALVARCFKA